MMKNLLFFCLISFACFSQSCSNNPENSRVAGARTDSSISKDPKPAPVMNGPIANAATILGRKEVPILCYHHIRPSSAKPNIGYTVSIATFSETMKALHDSGYHTILPDQLYNYLVHGASLPDKPFIISYDDTDEEQFTVGKTQMDKYGFKGVYFIMTISMGRPHYMSKDQIKQLSDEGNVVACHTWDHHMVTKYTGDDWQKQLDKPKKQLEAITGKTISYFAYPFGLWNPTVIPQLKDRGYKLAFQLSTKRDQQDPLYTVRRIIVAPEWNANSVLRAMHNSFH